MKEQKAVGWLLTSLVDILTKRIYNIDVSGNFILRKGKL